MPRGLTRLGLAAAGLVVVVLSTLLLDRAIGWAFLPGQDAPGLVYPPGSSVEYRTPEYHFVVHVNALGFRGEAFSDSPPGQSLRIVALGDSFTYGWGVGDEEAWPALVGRQHLGREQRVEVANLGWVGRGPMDYAELAERALPVLSPDLVIVAVLQGDDLEQVRPGGHASGGPPEERGVRGTLRRLLRAAYPSAFRLRWERQASLTAGDVQDAWRELADRAVSGFSPGEASRFAALEPDIRRQFEGGSLNPALVALAVRSPRYFVGSMDLDDARTVAAIDALGRALARIRRAASAVGAKVLVVAVPYGVYVGRGYQHDQGRLGFETRPDMLSSLAPDEAIARAAREAGVPFCSVLERFRRDPRRLFFALDGHFTVAGHALFAEAVAGCLRDRGSPAEVRGEHTRPP